MDRPGGQGDVQGQADGAQPGLHRIGKEGETTDYADRTDGKRERRNLEFRNLSSLVRSWTPLHANHFLSTNMRVRIWNSITIRNYLAKIVLEDMI
jgi:hypothetical protein